jgi:hypothetical protein
MSRFNESFDFVVDCSSDSRHMMPEKAFAQDRCAPTFSNKVGARYS